MELKIQLISMEMIKPASPTLEPRRKYLLSFLDQVAPHIFMPIVYFYRQNELCISDNDKSLHLKKSLSESLSLYYPLGGRFVNGGYVDCNDEGVPFFEAKANCSLDHVATNLVPENMNKLLPFELDEPHDFPMAVQVTHFQDGGISVGILMSHKVADAVSFFSFTNNWAAIARGGAVKDHRLPEFDSAAIFPPRGVSGFDPRVGIAKEELVSKIFTFPASQIAALQNKYSAAADHTPRRPSRVEALSCFIWTRFLSATESKPDPKKIYTIVHAVNLRTRFDPPLPENHFGNLSRAAVSVLAVEKALEINEILPKVRDSIKSINNEYVSDLRNGVSHLNAMKDRMGMSKRGELISFSFTSLCRLPLQEADYGWGKPVRVGAARLKYKNLVTFMDACDGNGGIEAWINLKKDDMEKFEKDPELKKFLVEID